MTQSEAEKQITKILAQLEKDEGVVVDEIKICNVDSNSLCRTFRKRRAAIGISYIPNVMWDIE